MSTLGFKGAHQENKKCPEKDLIYLEINYLSDRENKVPIFKALREVEKYWLSTLTEMNNLRQEIREQNEHFHKEIENTLKKSNGNPKDK